MCAGHGIRAGGKLKTVLGNKGKPKITKIEAAVFQLESAIELWFFERDVPSITTLAYSAHEILFELAEDLPIKVPTIKTPKFIPIAHKEEWRALFKLDYNFCKHREGKKALDAHYFSVATLPQVLYDGMALYRGLGFGHRLYFSILKFWVETTMSHIFLKDAEHEPLDERYVEACLEMGRREYFKLSTAQFGVDGSMGVRPWTPVVHEPTTNGGA